MDDRPRYDHLEAPHHLGRDFPTDPDAYIDFPRNRAVGSMLFLDLLLLFGSFAFASEGAWLIALIGAGLAFVLGVAVWRKLKQAIDEDMKADPSETLRRMVRPRR